ncbi:hypothetical protein HanLR1_Chr09g0309001 [Helianthus annuus]|nr:hypothetical protein HanHA89_Chr09g0329561 [Helianthus annuus]KAJ0706611.1 hypothetical protein HanLR1_Chr09g0309001 [Helianthus annuus]
MRIFRLHLVLTIPSKLWATFGFPVNFYQSNPFVLQLFESTVHDLHRFLNKVHRFIDSDLVERNVKISVS